MLCPAFVVSDVSVAATGAGEGGRTLSALERAGDVVSALVGHVALVTAGVLVLLLAWEVLRWRAVSRALRRRTTLYALAVDSFDPDVETIQRFGAQLADVARPRTAALDRSGRAIRVRMESAAHGRMLYALEVPADRVGVLRSAAPSGVELRDRESMDIPGLLAIDLTAARHDESGRMPNAAPEHDAPQPGNADEPLTGGEGDG